MGGDDADAGQKIANQIADLVEAFEKQKDVTIVNKPSKEFAQVLDALNETIENTLFPLVRSMDTRISQDIDAYKTLEQLQNDIEKLKKQASIKKLKKQASIKK